MSLLLVILLWVGAAALVLAVLAFMAWALDFWTNVFGIFGWFMAADTLSMGADLILAIVQGVVSATAAILTGRD